jgi:hypothetical protein
MFLKIDNYLIILDVVILVQIKEPRHIIIANNKVLEEKMNPYSSLVYDEKMLKIRYPTSGNKRFNQGSSSSSTQP